MLKASFKEHGQAKLDRLDQDDTQKACSEYAGQGAAEGRRGADREGEPRDRSSGRPTASYLGDWKNGEKIAQEGRGMQYSDDPKGPVGGNCYACHQLTPQEVSYGTIGRRLYQFGKTRGYTDEMRKYAYGKICNAEAYTACSNMPRFGHKRHPDRAADQGCRRAADGSGSPVNK